MSSRYQPAVFDAKGRPLEPGCVVQALTNGTGREGSTRGPVASYGPGYVRYTDQRGHVRTKRPHRVVRIDGQAY